MPPSKPLPPAILSALGLVSTSCGILGPCLDIAPCLDYVTYPSGTSGDTGTVTPCLDFPTETAQTGDTGASADTSPTTSPRVPDRTELLDELEDDGTLPADVVKKLKGTD
ncbi:MAG: hypothetical protein AAF602_04655 [Myxococcota bacterium]